MKKRILAALLLAPAAALFSQKTLLHCGRLIDCTTDGARTEMTIAVEAGKITAVAPGYLKPGQGDRLIDLKNRTVMPGLMDMHVHLEGQQSPTSYVERFTKSKYETAYSALVFGQKTLAAGFTTVRDLGGEGANIALRDAINKGLVTGPRIFTAGKTISITGGHGDGANGSREELWGAPGADDGVADGPDACRKAVRHQIKRGADLIKIAATGGVLSLARDGKRPSFSEEEIRAIVETANDAGVTVAAHAHGDEGMRRAVEAGVTSIEHGTMMSEATMDLMIKKGTFYVPTITAGRAVADSAQKRGFFPPMIAVKAAEIGPQIQKTFAVAYKKGVKIAFGTDAGVYPHGLNGLEFGFMVDAGMPPMAAIRSATVATAELLRVSDRLGTIEAGKLADIIAVDGDPLQDISAMSRVRFVMKEGAVFKNETP